MNGAVATEPESWSPQESRIYIVAGQRTVVAPLKVEGPLTGGPVRLTGLAEPASVVWFGLEAAEGAGVKGVEAWAGRGGRWTVGREATGAGFWALVFETGGLDMGSVVQGPTGPLPLVWVGGDSGSGEAVLGAAAAEASARGDAALLRAMVEPASRWPTERWRAGALIRAIDERQASGAGVVRSSRGLEGAAEGLARQVELRWRAALGRLAAEDEALARRLAARLVAVVDFGGVSAPAWPGETAGIGLLLDALLDPGQRGVDLAVRVEAFLARNGEPVVWVVDDACEGGALVGVAAVDPARVDVDFGTAGGVVRPGAGRAVEAPVTPPAAGAGQGGRGVDVAYRTPAARAVRVVREAIMVRPPGLDLGPLAAEWTMSDWTAGAPRTPAGGPAPQAAEWTTRARLLRLARAGVAEWVLFIECAGGEGGAGEKDVVTVWLGERGRGGSVVVASDGSVRTDGAPGGARATVAPGAGQAEGSWSAWVVLGERPGGAEGRLKLALERRDARGARSSFPRPMLPWQREPGRLLVDLTAWAR